MFEVWTTFILLYGISFNMEHFIENSSYNSSAASSKVSGTEDIEATKVKNHVKQLLKSRIFLGRYLERRLVNQSIGYRDIVLISAAELELKRDLLACLSKIRSSFPSTHWIGITSADVLGLPSSLCLWTEIDNQPFGPFWFQIRSIKFKDDEIILHVKCIRHISESFLELEPILCDSGAKTTSDNEASNVLAKPLNESAAETINSLKSAFTVSNIKEFITFIFAFILAVFTGSTAFVNFLGNFVLALMRESSIFVKNSTPMFLGVLDVFSKIVGGFYILIAMIFRPSNNSYVPPSRHAISYQRTPRQNSVYDDREFD